MFYSYMGLERNLFSCYRAAQKDIFTLHMKNGCQLLHNGTVVMTRVIHNQMYQLEISVASQDTGNIANVARSFGVDIITGSTQ